MKGQLKCSRKKLKIHLNRSRDAYMRCDTSVVDSTLESMLTKYKVKGLKRKRGPITLTVELCTIWIWIACES